MVTEQVFVYGTLRPPRSGTDSEDSRYYPEIEPYVQSSMAARLPEAVLYDLGTFPGAGPGEDVIHGDLLSVDGRAMAVLDRIEGHPGFYRREKAWVLTEAGRVEAWVYWAPGTLLETGHRLEGGDWFHRPRHGPSAPGEAGRVHHTPAGEGEAPPREDGELARVVRRLAESECVWMTTVRPDGRPHVSPVWQVWSAGRMYVVTTGQTVKAANLKSNPGVVVAHPDPVDPILLEGWATFARVYRAQLRPHFLEKYDWDLDGDPDYDTVIEIIPNKLMAWGKHGEGRWQGPQVMRVRLK